MEHARLDDRAHSEIYRVYGRDLETFLSLLGFHVEYIREDMKDIGIMNTELYFCRKVV